MLGPEGTEKVTVKKRASKASGELLFFQIPGMSSDSLFQLYLRDMVTLLLRRGFNTILRYDPSVSFWVLPQRKQLKIIK